MIDSSTIITNRHTLNPVASPPALRTPITRIFRIRFIRNDHSIGTGSIKIQKSLAILIAASAMITWRWFMHEPPSSVPFH